MAKHRKSATTNREELRPSGDHRSGTLWIVATPIGSLGDLAPRAREVLADVDLVLAEDTRRVRALLSHLGLQAKGRLRSLHEHNERARVPALIEALRCGRSLALVSDAGTPVLSDPGYLLVREARRNNLDVCSVPGPSSFAAALAAAGLAPLPATLCGFLPGRSGARQRRIAQFAQWPWTLVILLSPHRLQSELEDCAEILGRRRGATLLAELSKVHERATMGTLDELCRSREAEGPRGEYVLVVGPRENEVDEVAVTDERVKLEYQRALDNGASRRDALKTVARRLGLPRREVFAVLATDGEEGPA
jgi:16S rRNA (cytidine1402-2'-O)-methyltransferase